MSAQHFNFASKLSKNWGFGPNFAFLGENFPTRRKFSDNFGTAQNVRGKQLLSLPPPCYDTTGISQLSL